MGKPVHTITLKHLIINNEKKIGMEFKPDPEIHTLIKKLDNPRWSKNHKMVFVQNCPKNLTMIFATFKGVAWINTQDFFKNKNKSTKFLMPEHSKPINKRVLDKYTKTFILRGESVSTQRIYISQFKKFLSYFSGREIDKLTIEEITDYLLWEIENNKISPTLQNQMVNAIKYYYEKCLGHLRTVYNLPRRKRGKYLPEIFNDNELKGIICSIDNLKHKCIIMLIFSAGLRRGEVLNLKLNDIDFERKVLNIRRAKRDKDRITILSNTLIEYLKKYIEEYKPQEWLFNGEKGGKYSGASIWKIFKRAKTCNHIVKKGSVHLLRHTFATNLLESGTNLRCIQDLLGHQNIKTTEIYTHVAKNILEKIKSPLDNLNLD